ncbi:DNA-binding domain-containing protein [Hyphomicrobium sp.]|uniref:DNA-binding domain-containing protein n=1 Tax=Hyphomicrobium sp. TaxID=82 RepID=UPI002E323B19|nr:DNA-binding domain-containing protein [Hyphomicrobium sp.]HEX2842236.1 DNA-binding domain-containing protein [Hyphomicrobium sp.]
MPRKAPSLSELQSRFQAALLDGSDDVLRYIPASSRTSNAVLFGVYRHAYSARLVEVVRGAFPLLARYMGDEAFDALARRYVADYPSRHANARWYASNLPGLLGLEPWGALPVFKDVAAIEWQLDLAFDARDDAVLDLAALAKIPPESWGAVSFTPHPSVALLPFMTNTFDIWLALRNETEVPEARQLEEAEHVLVWRQGGVPKIRRLGAEETMLWCEASRGRSFGALAEMAATFDDPDGAALRVAQYLQGWLLSGLISEAMT